MDIPKLNSTNNRSREYNYYSQEQRDNKRRYK